MAHPDRFDKEMLVSLLHHNEVESGVFSDGGSGRRRRSAFMDDELIHRFLETSRIYLNLRDVNEIMLGDQDGV